MMCFRWLMKLEFVARWCKTPRQGWEREGFSERQIKQPFSQIGMAVIHSTVYSWWFHFALATAAGLQGNSNAPIVSMEVTTAVLEAFQCEPINYYKAIPCCETVKDYRMKYCFFCRLKMCFERLRDEQSEVNFESCPDVMPWIPCREPRAAICAASSGGKKTCFKLYTVGRLDPVSLKKTSL